MAFRDWEYALEKLSGAVSAIDDPDEGDIRTRLENAIMGMHTLGPGFFPDPELSKDWNVMR